MTTSTGRFTRAQIELQIARIERGGSVAEAPNELEPRPGGEMTTREPFGRWLLAQQDRGDWIDSLATAARADRAFPRDATPDQVRVRLQSLGADGDTLEQVDDAERCWRSL